MVPRSSKLDIFYLKADDGHLAALGPVYCERFETLDRPKTLLETQVTAVSAALTGTLRCRSITGKPWVRTYVLDAPRLTSDPTSLPSTGVCVPCLPLRGGLGESPWQVPLARANPPKTRPIAFVLLLRQPTPVPPHGLFSTLVLRPATHLHHQSPPARRLPSPPSPSPSTPLAAPSTGGDHQLFSPEKSPPSHRQSLRLLSIASVTYPRCPGSRQQPCRCCDSLTQPSRTSTLLSPTCCDGLLAMSLPSASTCWHLRC